MTSHRPCSSRSDRSFAFILDEYLEMSSTYEFFYLVLEGYTLICCVTIVLMISTVFGGVSITRSGNLLQRWEELDTQCFI